MIAPQELTRYLVLLINSYIAVELGMYRKGTLLFQLLVIPSSCVHSPQLLMQQSSMHSMQKLLPLPENFPEHNATTARIREGKLFSDVKVGLHYKRTSLILI